MTCRMGAQSTLPRCNPPIGPYVRLPATVEPWDPRSIEVAGRRHRADRRAPSGPRRSSTSAAPPSRDCPARASCDLAIATTPEDVPAVAAMLRELGFGPQPGPDPWPPSRPMLVGSLVRGGTTFRIHCHVLPGHRGARTRRGVPGRAARRSRAGRGLRGAQDRDRVERPDRAASVHVPQAGLDLRGPSQARRRARGRSCRRRRSASSAAASSAG